MMDVIITGGNLHHFSYLEIFISSLRHNGAFDGIIAVCDNSIEGSWDKPGKFIEGGSFSENQLLFFKKYQVDVYAYSELLDENKIERIIIDQIPSPTQRFPHKFFYTTLISKKYSQKADHICYFDADIFFQKPIKPLFDSFSSRGIFIVKEGEKIGMNHFLSKWIRFSDFSKLSNQLDFLNRMDNASNFCTGFFGGDAYSFHTFSLLCTLLASNQLVQFYSDQPTVNILKTYFQLPIKELSSEYVIHLGDLPKEDIEIHNNTIFFKKKASIAVHFNGDTKKLFSIIQSSFLGLNSIHSFQASNWNKVKNKFFRPIRRWKNRLLGK